MEGGFFRKRGWSINQANIRSRALPAGSFLIVIRCLSMGQVELWVNHNRKQTSWYWWPHSNQGTTVSGLISSKQMAQVTGVTIFSPPRYLIAYKMHDLRKDRNLQNYSP
ncbi:MAG: hypothetical protein A3D96_04505 [Chlamydiae bacterium RIFCSPHIGHO2_12_FULL_44_59]|nr:MAG: hypothetical protein A2796_04280 [Chlamydiae bacterium RIFCSPHIGHO2_01_FULL_44_39]OGN58321.1 MAG: hypothetical protein A3C42_01030 [Chlamydiae bacterium RIFCSPHIGHO2_02_FULL_45_9]OGN60350.1 MAG: hypothetical protein A3D96_04505 [Chlamydiae bacterium RIFCSPHIGHO2_12_FULL_44_59]OGN66333.1 MAG: hypothetical protein A2978_01950 [Chlamydiae bacterium RIFCSPLOWO2_01_FULL_44_52]OGN69284.1 MAG: hypothetical protein A3I67_00810 [Chlamydiae bacterium RIFCSPLOWO2_02_FULL_45_22]OGN70224.1 MAG: hyp